MSTTHNELTALGITLGTVLTNNAHEADARRDHIPANPDQQRPAGDCTPRDRCAALGTVLTTNAPQADAHRQQIPTNPDHPCPPGDCTPTLGTVLTTNALKADANRDQIPTSPEEPRPSGDCTPSDNQTPNYAKNRTSEAWHRLPEYALPSRFTVGEPGDAAIVFPLQWPSCGCPIPDAVLASAVGRAVKWGRRYALAMLMDRPYFDHAYQVHGIHHEQRHGGGPPPPPRRAITSEDVRRLAVTEYGALAAGFPAKSLGISTAYLAQAWQPGVYQPFLQALRSLGEFASHGYGLLLQGDSGVGKTCALALIAEVEARAGGVRQYRLEQHEWRQTGPARLRYLTLPQLEILLTPGRVTDEWQRQFHELCTVEHLFLDEFGTQTDNDRAQMLLFELFDARANALRPTHLATNSDLPTVLADTARGARLWQRLQECPRFTIIGANGRHPGAWRALLTAEGDPLC